jgi:nucleoside-diphosphate-sugar epimerase
MKTLVLGASGFIGSAFLKQDLDDDIEIVTRDNYTDATRYKKHIGDIKDKDFLKSLARQKFEKVINLAWEGLPDISEKTNRFNLEFQLNVIKVFADSGTKQFDMAGSCLEYGDFEGKAKEADIGGNLSDFANSKLQLLDFLRAQNLMYRWFRIFYVYGPRQHNKSLLASAYSCAKIGAKLHVTDPNIARDFIYIDDVASVICKLTSNLSAQGVFNIGSGVSTEITLLVSKVYDHFGLNYDVLKVDHGRTLTADTSRIRELCGWYPKFTIENGIKQYIRWAEQVDF